MIVRHRHLVGGQLVGRYAKVQAYLGDLPDVVVKGALALPQDGVGPLQSVVQCGEALDLLLCSFYDCAGVLTFFSSL